ncbi:hypothetical protein BGX24_000208 [Mortierella sp. AD032]|nr:hypothetical protein BGX24_000208 [Mortierella sp. AD032]
MVDQLIQDLDEQTMVLTRQMQEQEDSLKLYAVSIQTLEKRGGLPSASFPYHRLYELEKKCQALESHNKILTTKLELSDLSLGEQFLATEDFMELSAKSLVGLRSEIEAVEQAGLATRTLNDMYMSSITSFTDMTKRIGTSLSQKQVYLGAETNNASANSTIGLGDSRLMSILPEVPSTPVKRHSQSNVLPNLSMDTVDTNLALGSSSLFGNQSPSRMSQERNQWGSPQNPFQSPPPMRRPSTPRRTPMAGVIFSPKRRPRGGLRQHRDAPTPTKRNVNFLLDVVAEDVDRTPPPASSQGSSTLGRIGMGGGAKRVIPNNTNSSSTNGSSNGQGGARRVVINGSSVPSGVKSAKGEISKGPQRLNPFVTGNHNGSPPGLFSSPTKRLRLLDGDSTTHVGKKQRSSPTMPHQTSVVHAASSATAARIARRQSLMPESRNPFKVIPAATISTDKNTNSVMTSPPSNGGSSSSGQGSSRIPIPSPPPLLSAAIAAVSSITSTPTAAVPKVSTATAKRRLSMGVIGHGSSSGNMDDGNSNSNKISTGILGTSTGQSLAGNGIGGGPIRDASTRRRIRAQVTPPLDIPPFQQLGGGSRESGINGSSSSSSQFAPGELGAPRELGAPVSMPGRPEATRSKRRVSMMAALPRAPTTTTTSTTDAGPAEDDSASSSIPMPVTGSNRRRSFGPIRPLNTESSSPPSSSPSLSSALPTTTTFSLSSL